MDIRRYFTGESSSNKEPATSVSDSEDVTSDSDCSVAPPPKKQCISQPPASSVKRRSKSRPLVSIRKYNKKWEQSFPWLEYSEDHQGAFCKICKKWGKSLQRTGGAWITKPFKTWKKAMEKMRAHSHSDVHIHMCEVESAASKAEKEGSVIQQLQNIGGRKVEK